MIAGTEIAIETADAVLMKSDLRDVAIALDLSRRTVNRIHLNFVWAFGYNIVRVSLLLFVVFVVCCSFVC